MKYPIDFEDDKFEETNGFEQEFIFVDSEVSKEDMKVYVTGRVISYGDKWTDVQFVGDLNNTDPKVKKTLVALAKKVKFGDFVKVKGNAWNRVELTDDIEDVVDISDDGLFGDTEVSGIGGKRKAVKTYITQLEILGGDNNAFKPKLYSEDDFVLDELIDDEPAASNSLEDDDLPF